MAQFLNFSLHGSTINSAQGNVSINNIINGNSERNEGLHNLGLVISHGAMHDSAERYPAPNCHPGTRMAVRQIIMDWIYDKNLPSPFFWLYGPAGAGKTAILQAIAELLCSPSGSTDENYGGSFFFSRGKNGRDQGHFLFSTLAFQLALKVPGLSEQVNHVMEVYPTLHTKSMAVQLQSLIVDSFRRLSPIPQSRSYLVIIDGLDECHDKTTQQSILNHLYETIAVHKLPLRFLIGSRPETHIRASFDQESLYKITRRVVLDESFDPGRDIQVFLQDGFAKISTQNPILSHVDQPWPGRGIVDLLVQRSSGQFIYAATVLKFVGADFCSPTKQLALILKPDPSAFSDLDQLYAQILSVYPTTVNIVQVLGIIITFQGHALTPGVIEDILGMEEGELKLVLRGLSSLIAFVGDRNEEYLTGKVVSDVGRPYFLHASFGDFLVNSTRSGAFYVDKQKYQNQGTIWSFSLITKTIASSWRITSPNRVRHGKTWEYFAAYLPKYFFDSPAAIKEAIMTDIDDLVQEFWTTSSDGAVDVSLAAMRHLLEILQKLGFPAETATKSQHLIPTFDALSSEYRKMLDQSLVFAMSKSHDMNDLLSFLPGIVVQNRLTIGGMAVLYRVDVDALNRLIISNIALLSPFNASVNPRSHYTLADYAARFFRDRDRVPLHHCDPVQHHISICRHFLAVLDRLGSNASDLQSYDDLAQYVQSNLFHHLFTATEVFFFVWNIPVGHPAIQILDDLESITYCGSQSHSRGGYLVRCCVSVLLRWAHMLNSCLKGVAVFISDVDLIRRVRRLTDRIYREILFTEVNQRKILLGLNSGFGSNSFRKNLQPEEWTGIQLSWELLGFVSVGGGILSSFTDFITTPEISGPFYISPDVYDTQITEYSLESIYTESGPGMYQHL